MLIKGCFGGAVSPVGKWGLRSCQAVMLLLFYIEIARCLRGSAGLFRQNCHISYIVFFVTDVSHDLTKRDHDSVSVKM